MENDNLYSPLVGAIYLFNLLLGTGVLTMPAVFEQAGYISGIICVMLLCLISYIQTTFLIESMANANFVKRMQQSNDIYTNEMSSLLSTGDLIQHEITGPNDEYNEENISLINATSVHNDHQLYSSFFLSTDSDEKEFFLSSSHSISTIVTSDVTNKLNVHIETNLQNNRNKEIATRSSLGANVEDTIHSHLQNINHLDKRFQIVDKFELGNMTELFLNKYLSKFFFISITSYLFGDLLIYNSMMSKSLRDITCTSNAYCTLNDNNHEHLDSLCWDQVSISRRNAYRLFLLGFISILGPLTYAKIQKTKIIQIMTIILRWMAFLSMIGITIKIFATNEAKGRPKTLNISNVPKLFGICVYSFMCHHSIPSIITPIKKKSKVFLAILIDYILVFAFYVIISLTAIFAFENIEQLYTLNFQIDKCISNYSNPNSIIGFNIFLPTFPIFTLFSSYTILALTLINNMKILIDFSEDMRYSRLIRYSMPLIAIMPPLLIALFTEDVSSIVQYVGSYSGTLIQYVFPTLLVYYSRTYVQTNFMVPYIQHWMDRMSLKVPPSTLDIKGIYRKLNPFASTFQSNFWIYFTAIWWIICLFFVTTDHLRDIFKFY